MSLVEMLARLRIPVPPALEEPDDLVTVTKLANHSPGPRRLHRRPSPSPSLMGDELRIRGILETQEMIRAVPADISKALPGALIAASAVIERELLTNIPHAAKGHDPRSPFPPLDQSITTDILVNEQRGLGVSSTGFGAAGPVALYLEYGHRIVSHRGIDSGKRTVREPFMRSSTDKAADAAIDAFAEAIAAALEKT